MASVFVVRSRRPLLHYYSYPARRGYRRLTRAGYAESNRAAPLARLRKGGPGTLRPVCTLEVLPSSTSRTTTTTTTTTTEREREREKGPYFLSTSPWKTKAERPLDPPHATGGAATSATMKTRRKNVCRCRHERLFVSARRASSCRETLDARERSDFFNDHACLAPT